MQTVEQGQFDFILGVSNRELLRTDEIMRRFGVKKEWVYDLIADGSFETHRKEVAGSTQLITKRSVLAWLAASANYTTEDTVNLLEKYCRQLSKAERLELLKRLQRMVQS